MLATHTYRPAIGGYGRFLRDLHRLLATAGIARAHGFCVLGAPGDDGRMGRVRAFVEENVSEPLRVDDLAGVAGLSRYHFSRVFHDETGETPWAYVRRARVERAKGLLREGRPPAEAAVEAGFCDQSHLTRAFRAVDGRTPGAFQQDEAARERRDAGERAGAPERTNVQDG